MAVNFNSDVIKRIVNDLKVSISDGVPQQIANQIVPVLVSNPERIVDIVRGNGNAAAGAISVYTTPTNKDFYLTSVSIMLSKDAACDLATGNVATQVYIDGAAQVIAELSTITLTQQTIVDNKVFPVPIKLDRNTAIVLNATAHAAGLLSKSICITGYTVETLKKNA